MIENIKKNKIIVILCTLPDDKLIASKLTQILLHDKLAACISIIYKIRSFYYWENQIKHENEIQLFIKTKYCLKNKIFNTIKKIHPYKIPELLILPVLNGEKHYLSWIKSSLQ